MPRVLAATNLSVCSPLYAAKPRREEARPLEVLRGQLPSHPPTPSVCVPRLASASLQSSSKGSPFLVPLVLEPLAILPGHVLVCCELPQLRVVFAPLLLRGLGLVWPPIR